MPSANCEKMGERKKECRNDAGEDMKPLIRRSSEQSRHQNEGREDEIKENSNPSNHTKSDVSWFYRGCDLIGQGAISLNRSIGFNVFCCYPLVIYCILGSLLLGISMSGWILFLVPNAEMKGFEERVAVLLSLAGGIGHITGRILTILAIKVNKDIF